MTDQRKRGFVIKPEKLALIQNIMADKGYSQEKLAEVAGLSIDTISKMLRGKNPPERKTIEAIAKALNINATDIVDANELHPNSQTAVHEQISIDWRLVCSKMLEKQQETQRLRSKATEMGFELNIYVPLGLVERKQQQRRTGNIEAKQLNRLEPEVIIKTYQHDEFLQRFTEQNQGSGNKHTAIIGEAGVGKTTLLSKIASYIEENTDNLFLFISLSDLKGQNLDEFILKKSLFSEAIGVSHPELDVTPEIEKKFKERFRKGSVWLLLDGVDEMPKTTPLHWIKSQLTDWLNHARVVLTCRNNVWDASVNNEMTGFDTFKAQDFEPEQVNQFIENWFKLANDKQQGDLLKAKLKETGRERIRDLVRNPLRLSLLCQTFYVNQADLPETKAALYKRFIMYLQEWKQHLYPINRETQEELHKALGKLALAGINSETKFRFRESVARQEMGNHLFELACKVNWLHPVDRDIQYDEPAFSFFHPNFQEYFAALATKAMIDLLLNSNKWEEHDWDADYYLPSVVKTAAEHLEKIHDKERLIFTLKHLKQWITSHDSAKDARRRSLCYSIILHYAKNITYPEFFKAWHSESSPIQFLESQFINIHLQLQATDKTFPIVPETNALQNETDISAISQEICNQIYSKAFPGKIPPEVNNAPQVKRLIPSIKKQLQTQNLAIIFNNCQPNQELIAFCRKITDVVSIAWITDEALEAPLQGFPPNQPNLLNAIQSWINEIE